MHAQTSPRAAQRARRRPRGKLIAGALVFVACFASTYALSSRSRGVRPHPSASAPAVEARGPAPPKSFVHASRPQSDAEAGPPTEDLAEDALRALASQQAAREDALRAAIFGLADDPSATIETRLDRYRRAIESALADAGLEHLLAFRGVLIEAFLRNDAVQAELAALPPGARQSQIDRIRAEFGYDEAALERMREIDARRDARWARGLAYMDERARLEDLFEGELLAEELRHLRLDHFGAEAETIEREEASDFFRYARPRVYGRN